MDKRYLISLRCLNLCCYFKPVFLGYIFSFGCVVLKHSENNQKQFQLWLAANLKQLMSFHSPPFGLLVCLLNCRIHSWPWDISVLLGYSEGHYLACGLLEQGTFSPFILSGKKLQSCFGNRGLVNVCVKLPRPVCGAAPVRLSCHHTQIAEYHPAAFVIFCSPASFCPSSRPSEHRPWQVKSSSRPQMLPYKEPGLIPGLVCNLVICVVMNSGDIRAGSAGQCG